MYVLVLLQASRKIPNVPVLFSRVCLPAWFLHRWVHLMILVEGPEEKIPLLWTVKFFFSVLFNRMRLPECLSVHATALPVKDKCMRQWKQICRGIKIDAERHGWLLALNTEALAVFHLSSVLSPSLFLSTSRPPAATGLSPQRRATIIGLSINTMGREFFLDHLITKRIRSTCRRGFPLRRLISFSFIIVLGFGEGTWFDWRIKLQHYTCDICGGDTASINTEIR